MSDSKGVQAGGVECWIVDDDKTVVKYCDDNIVHIFVSGDDTTADHEDADHHKFAIVAQSTLRLRIAPNTDDDNYQEIAVNNDDHYDDCGDDDNLTPPPLPPRQYSEQHCQTFPRRRKNLFHHLGVDTTLPSGGKKKKKLMPVINQSYTFNRKDLVAFLGIESVGQIELPESGYLSSRHFKKDIELAKSEYLSSRQFRKDLSKYLGIDNQVLGRIEKRNKTLAQELQLGGKNSLADSEGNSSIDSSSSSFSSSASYFGK